MSLTDDIDPDDVFNCSKNKHIPFVSEKWSLLGKRPLVLGAGSGCDSVREKAPRSCDTSVYQKDAMVVEIFPETFEVPENITLTS